MSLLRSAEKLRPICQRAIDADIPNPPLSCVMGNGCEYNCMERHRQEEANRRAQEDFNDDPVL